MLSYPERAKSVSGSLPNAMTMPSQKLPRPGRIGFRVVAQLEAPAKLLGMKPKQ